MENQELTFGQKAVGLTFNPSGNDQVRRIKEKSAALIDELHELRQSSSNEEVIRQAAIAITEVQTAQMWGVKAATWESN